MKRNTPPLSEIQDVRHPYTDYRLKEAIDLAQQHARTFDNPVPETMEEVRVYIKEMASHAGHIWITGMAALDLLDMAIDGRDLLAGNRILGTLEQ